MEDNKDKEYEKGHVHSYRIFRDTKAVGFLTFYCTKCLKLRKIEKVYEDEPQHKNQ